MITNITLLTLFPSGVIFPVSINETILCCNRENYDTKDCEVKEMYFFSPSHIIYRDLKCHKMVFLTSSTGIPRIVVIRFSYFLFPTVLTLVMWRHRTEDRGQGTEESKIGGKQFLLLALLLLIDRDSGLR